MTTITPGGFTGSTLPGGGVAMDPRIKARREAVAEEERRERLGGLFFAVSYTHLTLPTIYSV